MFVFCSIISSSFLRSSVSLYICLSLNIFFFFFAIFFSQNMSHTHTQSHTYKNTNALSFSSFVLVSVFSFLFLSTKPFPRQLYSSLINMSCTEVKVKYFAKEKKNGSWNQNLFSYGHWSLIIKKRIFKPLLGCTLFHSIIYPGAYQNHS